MTPPVQLQGFTPRVAHISIGANKHCGQRTGRHASRACADQCAKDAQAHRLGERCERNDGGFFFHDSLLIEI